MSTDEKTEDKKTEGAANPFVNPEETAPAAPESAKTPVVEETTSEEPKPDKKVEKSQLDLDIELAQANQARINEMRKAGPDKISVARAVQDERTRLEMRYVPEAFPAEAFPRGYRRKKGDYLAGVTMSVCWGMNRTDTNARHLQKLSECWEPVCDVVNGKKFQVTATDGDLLYKRPVELSRENMEALTTEAETRLNDEHKKFESGVDSDAITENKSTVTRGNYQE